MINWDEATLQKYVDEGREESLTLDYKRDDFLPLTKNSDKQRLDITKDVSAMANSAGGVIIYGIAEYDEKDKRHLPKEITPVDRTLCSKERLEHIINNIRPKIDGVIIHSVQLSSSPDHVAYVVEIPPSTTAHQAMDKRYYKRFNFESVPMDDYEIRDVMGRGQHPKIELEFEIEITQRTVRTDGLELSPHMASMLTQPTFQSQPKEPEYKFVTIYILRPYFYNAGKIYAQYINAFIEIPDIIRVQSDNINSKYRRKTFLKDGIAYYRHYEDNTVRDIIGHDKSGLGLTPNYGPARHVPILPSRYLGLEIVRLNREFDRLSIEDLYIEWEVSADNAPPHTGKVLLKDIKVVDKRDTQENDTFDEEEED